MVPAQGFNSNSKKAISEHFADVLTPEVYEELFDTLADWNKVLESEPIAPPKIEL